MARGRASMLDEEEAHTLLAEWNSAASPSALAHRLGIKPTALSSMVYRLRKKYNLPFKKFELHEIKPYAQRSSEHTDYLANYGPAMRVACELVANWLCVDKDQMLKHKDRAINSVALKLAVYISLEHGKVRLRAIQDYFGYNGSRATQIRNEVTEWLEDAELLEAVDIIGDELRKQIVSFP